MWWPSWFWGSSGDLEVYEEDAVAKIIRYDSCKKKLLIADLQTLLSLYDANNDGILDEEEMANIQRDYATMGAEILEKYDRNKDGILQETEVDLIIEDLKNDSEKLAKTLGWLALRRRYDRNRDGVLDSEELLALAEDIQLTDLPVRYVGYSTPFLESIRYTAYTSDLGESARPLIGKRFVQYSYGVSAAYVLGDVFYEGYKDKVERQQENNLVARTVIKRSIFQTLASLALPALTIHTVVHRSAHYFNRIGRYQRWGPTIAGLSLVPALPFMFDHPVESATDYFFNKFWPVRSDQSFQHC